MAENGDSVEIIKNGSIPKFVDKIDNISFSAKRAHVNGQRVLYITERCVFELSENGLRLTQVYDGVDVKKDILELLPFEVEVDGSIDVK